MKKRIDIHIKTVKIEQGEESEHADSCDVCVKGDWHVAHLIYLL